MATNADAVHHVAQLRLPVTPERRAALIQQFVNRQRKVVQMEGRLDEARAERLAAIDRARDAEVTLRELSEACIAAGLPLSLPAVQKLHRRRGAA